MDEMTQKATSDRLLEVCKELHIDMIRFVIRRQDAVSDKEAAESLGISPNTVKGWKQKGYPIDEAVALMAADGLTTALELRRRTLAKAMAVKIRGLDSGDESLRQKVATEIIEWELGKASQRQEHLLKNLDLSQLTVEQLERIASGEEPIRVLATPGTS